MHSILETIDYSWFFEWPPRHTALSRTPGGHTLHYMVSGSYTLERDCNKFNVGSGDIVYFNDSEQVRYLGREEPVTMYSVNFTAREIPPLPPENRIYRNSTDYISDFKNIYEGFHQSPGLSRSLSSFTSLWKILHYLFSENVKNSKLRDGHKWWEVEEYIRLNHDFRASPADLASLFHISPSTLYRNCRKATGKSPEKQIKDIRMSEAVNLMKYTDMNISQIAAYLKYSRLHEFSREFSHHYKMPPSKFIDSENC